ncbi:hypothetical protein QBC39DRAFT_393986 [Podospora conica]|nr:hypothetical protein QBC39DRAFT_393986 [Schizothecium conicum]
MRSSIFAAALLAACAQAVQITGITKDQKIDLASGYTVTWSTVNSDPSTAHLFLVNMAGGGTPFSKDLGEIDLKKGSITVKEPVAAESGYQFNIQSVDPLNTGILAQSQQFQVVKGDAAADDKTSKTSPAATTAAAATSSGSLSEATEEAAAQTTTFSTATATGSGSGASNATRTGTQAPASTGGAASNKVGVLAALAGLLAVAL